MLENGGEFVIERLYRGSVLNHRSFLLRDKIAVFARCTTPVSLYFLSLDKFYEIRSKYLDFHFEIKRLEDYMVGQENPLALDYVLNKKRQVALDISKKEERFLQHRNFLTVELKNAVMTHVVKYREFRRVPKLKDILMMAIQKKKKEMQAARKKQQNMMLDNAVAYGD